MWNVFEFNDYKSLLKHILALPQSPRGYAKKLAEAAGCQRSYFSGVINNHLHLTPDHACGIAEFLRLSEQEADYFLLLIERERCGTQRLRARISKKLKALKEEHENLAKRLNRPSIAADSSGASYYSSWLWSAVHILVSVPEFQSPKEIAKKLRLPENFILNLLQSLENLGLVKRSGSRWIYSSASLHVSRDSPLVALHHGNWRQQAVLHSQIHPLDGIHYTTVTAMSANAAEQIKNLILKLIDESSAIAGPSASEDLLCLNLDFFKPAV